MCKFNKETNQVGDKDHNLWEIKSVKLYKKGESMSEEDKNLWYFIFPIISKKRW